MLGSVLVAGTIAVDEREDILAFWSFLSLRQTEYIYMQLCMSESLCCIPETNMIL